MQEYQLLGRSLVQAQCGEYMPLPMGSAFRNQEEDEDVTDASWG